MDLFLGVFQFRIQVKLLQHLLYNPDIPINTSLHEPGLVHLIKLIVSRDIQPVFYGVTPIDLSTFEYLLLYIMTSRSKVLQHGLLASA